MNFTGQIGQDRFVVETLEYKRDGTFLEIGCAEPIRCSNTHVLEKSFNWSGVSIDIQDIPHGNDPNSSITWQSERPRSKHVIADALAVDYSNLLKDSNMPSVIDYLSLDLEPPSVTLECLFKIPFDQYKFRVITFETDEYRDGGDERVRISRDYLQSKGYTLVAAVNRQDDFYVLNESM